MMFKCEISSDDTVGIQSDLLVFKIGAFQEARTVNTIGAELIGDDNGYRINFVSGRFVEVKRQPNTNLCAVRLFGNRGRVLAVVLLTADDAVVLVRAITGELQ